MIDKDTKQAYNTVKEAMEGFADAGTTMPAGDEGAWAEMAGSAALHLFVNVRLVIDAPGIQNVLLRIRYPIYVKKGEIFGGIMVSAPRRDWPPDDHPPPYVRALRRLTRSRRTITQFASARRFSSPETECTT